MEALKVHMKIESDTVKIPGLSRFIGKRVEIILLEDVPADKKTGKYHKLKGLKGAIQIDPGDVTSLRGKSSL